MPQRSIMLRTLDLFAIFPFLEFEDTLSAVLVEASKLETFAGCNTHFDRINGTKRFEQSDQERPAA